LVKIGWPFILTLRPSWWPGDLKVFGSFNYSY